jgi:hypothetical protein
MTGTARWRKEGNRGRCDQHNAKTVHATFRQIKGTSDFTPGSLQMLLHNDVSAYSMFSGLAIIQWDCAEIRQMPTFSQLRR